ncbi:MAG: amidohydrolase family protein [Sphingomonadales bacterium]|nr:amidohydrolase family protein [Sphingomonadales bacterium]
MRGAFAALVLTLLPAPAAADTLVDRVNGLTFTAEGRLDHFTGLLIGNDGRVAQVLHAGDKRPRADFAVDGRQRTMLPGFIVPALRLMPVALAAIAPASPGAPLPPPRPEDRDLALATIQPQLLSRGVTTVADAGTTIEDWQTYRRAGDEARLSIRIVAYAAGTQAMTLIGGPRPTPWLYDDRLRAVGVLLEAPAGATPAGDVQLKNWMSRAAMDHFQPLVRADAAATPGVRAAIEELSRTYQGDRRWRVEAAIATALPEPLAEMAAGLDRTAGLRRYTVDAAQPMFAEGRLGRLAVGTRADFVLVDADLELSSASELRSNRVAETWVNGRKVWVRETAGQGAAAEGR